MTIKPKLTKKQTLIFDLVINETLGIKAICSRLKISRQTLNEHIRKLKAKGYLIGDFRRALQIGGYGQPSIPKKPSIRASPTNISQHIVSKLNNKKNIRLHGNQFSIDLISKHGTRYDKLIKKNNIITIGQSTVVCYPKNIQVFTQEGVSFYGKTDNECDNEFIKYMNILYAKIENRLSITIKKDQYMNMRWVRRHYAFVDDEYAKKVNKEGLKLIIFDDQNGKQRILVDFSLKLDEMEMVHNKKAKQDTKNYAKYVEDFVKNTPLTNSQIVSRFNDLQEHSIKNEKTIENLLNVMKQIIQSKI